MEEELQAVLETVWAYLPNLIAAVLILVAGWIFALAIGAAVRTFLRKTRLDSRIADWLQTGAEGESVRVDEAGGKLVYYLVLILVLVAFFQALGLTLATEPLNELLNQIFEFLPRLLGAGILLAVAWVLAASLRFLTKRAVSATRLEERLRDKEAEPQEGGVPVAKSLGDIVYWLIFLLFLPAVLGALALEGLLDPVRSMLDRVLTFLPNLFAAAVILLLWWFAARVLQRLVTNLLAAVGVDRLSERAGLSRMTGSRPLSDILGLIVYVLVLIPVLIGALNALQLQAITQPASNMLNLILEAVPLIFAAALVLIVAYAVGKVLAGAVASVGESIGVDRLPVKLGLTRQVPEGKHSPSQIAATVVLVLVMLFAFIEAAELLGFDEVAGLAAQFTLFAGHVALGLVIFGAGLYLANWAAEAVLTLDKPHSGLLAWITKVAILLLAGAMALQEIGLAEQIISLAFGLLLGALAVAAAIAFGIGGRDVAARRLKEWEQSWQADSGPQSPSSGEQ